MNRSRLLAVAGALVGVVVCVIAVRALSTTLRGLSWDEVELALLSMAPWRFFGALALVGLSYAWLSNYDRIGLWAADKRPRQRRIFSTSFVAYAVSKTFGFPALTSGLVRLRRYRHTGFGIGDLTRFLLMASSTVWLGFALVMGALLMVNPTVVLPLSDDGQRALGTAMVAAGVAWVALASKNLGVVRVRRWHFRMPSAQVASVQLLVGAVDWILMASVLWILLPGDVALYEVVLAMGAAQIVAVIAHVPGGAGVVEATLLVLLKDRVDRASLAGALVAFRVLYFLVPLALAGLYVAVEQLAARWGKGRRAALAT